MDAEKVFLADLDPSVSLVGNKIVEGVVSVYQVVSSEQTTSALAADLSSVSFNNQAMQIHILSIRTWEEVKRSQDVVPELFADFLETLVLATAGRACFSGGLQFSKVIRVLPAMKQCFLFMAYLPPGRKMKMFFMLDEKFISPHRVGFD